MAWFESTNAVATQGSKVITISDGADTGSVRAGDELVLGNFAGMEISSKTATDITLVKSWDNGDFTGSLVVKPLKTDHIAATEAMRESTRITANNFAENEKWGTELGTVEYEGYDNEIHTARTMQQMDADVQAIEDNANSLVGSVHAMTKAEFFALAEQRKASDAGRFSGFFEWGKHYLSTDGKGEPVNNGLWCRPYSEVNSLFMGRTTPSGGVGNSTLDHSILSINGVSNNMLIPAGANHASITIKFPPAPDGTETYDTSDGSYVQHASSALAFASETATNKVIITRQDYVFIEQFHEKLSEHDVFCPLGNTQYGATTFDGMSLSNNLIAQGYSAFGDWDTETKGYHKRWSTMTDAEKVKAIQNPDNNIYSDDGELIQVKYRVRVVKGMGDEWAGTHNPNVSALNYSDFAFVKPRGSGVVSSDFTDTSSAVYPSRVSSFNPTSLALNEGLYAAAKAGGVLDTSIAHNGLCFAIPVALVQR